MLSTILLLLLSSRYIAIVSAENQKVRSCVVCSSVLNLADVASAMTANIEQQLQQRKADGFKRRGGEDVTMKNVDEGIDNDPYLSALKVQNRLQQEQNVALPLVSNMKVCLNEAYLPLGQALFEAIMVSEVHGTVRCEPLFHQ